MKAKISRNILIGLLAFLGLGAIWGGGALVVSPSGEFLKMPIHIIEGTIFSNFLIPGLFLFSILGVIPVILVFALLKKPKAKLAEKINFFKDMHWTWTFCIYIGFILIMWIQLEMLIINAVHWVHTFYVFIGIAIVFFALLPEVRNLYKK